MNALDLEEGKRLLKYGRTGWLRDWLYNNVDALLAATEEAAEEAEKLREALCEISAMGKDDYDHGSIMDPDGYAAVALCAQIADAALTPPEPLSAPQQDTKSAPYDAQPRVLGKPFRCYCGVNVFKTTDGIHFKCNGCGEEYVGEKATSIATQETP